MTEEKREALEMPRTVYAIRCRENGKIYIGSAADVKKRFQNHISQLRCGAKGRQRTVQSKNMQSDFDKYGVDAFELYVIEKNIKYSDSYAKESYYINMYDACNPENGYNSTGSKSFLKSKIRIIEGLPPKKE